MIEVWKPIPGYVGNYEASDLGRIKSNPRPSTRGGILRPRIDRKGYPGVVLYLDGRPRSFSVHVLIARTFLGPGAVGLEVCHNDEDPLNSALVNLRWDTRSANHLDRSHCRHGHPYSGENVIIRTRGRLCRACLNARKRKERIQS